MQSMSTLMMLGLNKILARYSDMAVNVLGIPALRICSLCFILAAFDVIAIASFQSLGNGMYALYASFLRQLVLILPLAYVLSKMFGLKAVWYSIPLAELGCAFFDIYLMKKIYDKKIANL